MVKPVVAMSLLPGVLRALGVRDLTRRQSRCGRGLWSGHVLDKETEAVSLPRVPREPEARS